MPINSGQQNTEHHDEHGIEKPRPHPVGKTDTENPGYEITDVNTRGIVVFLTGMVAFLVVFFVLCWAMGKVINVGLLRQDNDEARHTPMMATAGGSPSGGKTENLASNASMEQKEADAMAQTFPTPRLDADDSNQQTADIHAREDLLLEHYTAVEAGQGERVGAVRIPIERAMQLIVQRGLPASNGVQGTMAADAPSQQFAGDRHYEITAPLTNGFARTAYELDEIESRQQKMRLSAGEGKPAGAETHAKLEKR